MFVKQWRAWDKPFLASVESFDIFSFTIDFRIRPKTILWKIRRKHQFGEKTNLLSMKHTQNVCQLLYVFADVQIENAESDNSERPSVVEFFSIVSAMDGKSKANLNTNNNKNKKNNNTKSMQQKLFNTIRIVFVWGILNQCGARVRHSVFNVKTENLWMPFCLSSASASLTYTFSFAIQLFFYFILAPPMCMCVYVWP